MIVVSEIIELKQVKSRMINNDSSFCVGFVPTMGALHEGHLSLIEAAKKQCDIVICSVFVNPTQFNEKSDLQNYPRTLEKDLQLLKKNGCDIVFTPSVEEMYPTKNEDYFIDLNGLGDVLEGKFRPGHFNGVCMVVEKLFKIVEPNKAFFGIKDFQQVAVIKHLVIEKQINVEIVSCPIKRDKNGLALSSRNTLLTDVQREKAKVLSQTIFKGKEVFDNGGDLGEMYDEMLKLFKQSDLKLEYLEVVDNKTLKAVRFVNSNCSICIAAYCGDVRLIDNCQLS
ncbi:MAG TPA: pantoate--beta-alanine ligase [Crocinitomix sp.]|nr:pantoate--beta-alanine ligase [Crocinitomix sp.]